MDSSETVGQPQPAPGAGAEESGERLGRIADRLEELARLLRECEPGDERAVELAGEAAELAAEAGSEVDRGLRAAQAPGHEQTELL